MLPKFTSYMKYSLEDTKQHSINQSLNQSPLFGVTSGLTTSWRFFRIVSLMISSIRGLGSSTGTRRVLPRCWLNCRAHPSTCPSLHHSLMDAWLSLSHTPSSLWIYRNPIVSNCGEQGSKETILRILRDSIDKHYQYIIKWYYIMDHSESNFIIL